MLWCRVDRRRGAGSLKGRGPRPKVMIWWHEPQMDFEINANVSSRQKTALVTSQTRLCFPKLKPLLSSDPIFELSHLRTVLINTELYGETSG